MPAVGSFSGFLSLFMTALNHAPLVIDIAGTTLTDVDRQRLAHPLVGGMILFGRNWQDRVQLTAL